MISAPDFTSWLDYAPFAFAAEEKSALMLDAMRQLSVWHASQCDSYARILSALKVQPNNLTHLQDVPYLPVRLFKEFELRSVESTQIFKTMTSSGTSGQQVSRIYLDKETASLQTL